MDVFFHAASAALLASALKERRPRQLLLAGAIAMLPDLVWVGGRLVVGPTWNYAISHSLLHVGLAALIVSLFNWRVALGLPLHILIDTPLHKPSVLYRSLGVEGIDWYQGRGVVVAVALWAALIAVAVVHLMLVNRRRVLCWIRTVRRR
jgi:hypothetical protein